MLHNRLQQEDYMELNQLLKNLTSSKEGVNAIHFLTAKPHHKCSAILRQANNIHSIGYHPTGIKKDDDDQDFYYGLHPCISAKSITKAMANGAFYSPTTLRTLMDDLCFEHKDVSIVFKLHQGDEDYLCPLYGATLVKMAMKFGFSFTCDTSIITPELLHYIEQQPALRYDDKTQTLHAYCGLQADVIESLHQFHLGFEVNEETIKITSQGQSFQQFYQDSSILLPHIHLLRGDVYYSGVLPRCRELTCLNQSFNREIDTFQFLVERTTFATLDVFDNSDVIKHPLIHQYVDVLTRLYEEEDHAQLNLSKPYTTQEEDISHLNDYLKKSMNTHTIAVSGNIETSDSCLILGKRNTSSIDSGVLYPSVNGQSEFKDKYPDIYKTSVYEDYPTLDYENKYRLDFEQEINREAYAELNVRLLDSNWQYLGVSFMFINNEHKTDIQTRRMHFNVLAKNYTKETFLSVDEAQHYATEKFENNAILALCIHREWSYAAFQRSFQLFLDNIGDFASLLLGFVLLFNLLSGDITIQQNVIQTMLTLATSIAIAFIFIKKCRAIKQHYSATHDLLLHIHVVPFSKHKNDQKKLSKIAKQITKVERTYDLHALTILMILLHYIYQDSEY